MVKQNKNINELLEKLPSKEGYERDIAFEQANELGICDCGDVIDGEPIFKFLAKEGVMITYVKRDNLLHYMNSMKLHY